MSNGCKILRGGAPTTLHNSFPTTTEIVPTTTRNSFSYYENNNNNHDKLKKRILPSLKQASLLLLLPPFFPSSNNGRFIQRTCVLHLWHPKTAKHTFFGTAVHFWGPVSKNVCFELFGAQKLQNTRSLEQPSISSLQAPYKALHKAPYKAPNAAPERAPYKAPELLKELLKKLLNFVALFQRTCVLSFLAPKNCKTHVLWNSRPLVPYKLLIKLFTRLLT